MPNHSAVIIRTKKTANTCASRWSVALIALLSGLSFILACKNKLQLAATKSDSETAFEKRLEVRIKNGQDLDQPDPDFHVPFLAEAMDLCYVDSVKTLLSHSVKASFVQDGRIASVCGGTYELDGRDERAVEIVNGLIVNGADVNAQDGHQETILNRLAADGLTGAAEQVLKQGADVNARRWGGCTPLISAAAMGRRSMVELLLHHGADVNARDDSGWTPLAHCEYGPTQTNLTKDSNSDYPGTLKILQDHDAQK
jgi:hypothetical protein